MNIMNIIPRLAHRLWEEEGCLDGEAFVTRPVLLEPDLFHGKLKDYHWAQAERMALCQDSPIEGQEECGKIYRRLMAELYDLPIYSVAPAFEDSGSLCLVVDADGWYTPALVWLEAGKKKVHSLAWEATSSSGYRKMKNDWSGILPVC